MIRSELIDRLSKKFPWLSATDVKMVVELLLDRMSHALSQGERIEIRDFGIFSSSLRPPRTGRNPKTGELVNVPAKHIPHFKPGKALRQRANFGTREKNRS